MNLRLALALICLNPALHAAPPKELVSLQQSYAFAVAERVNGPHETALTALNAKFTAALDNAATQAKSVGDLPAVLAIQADKKLLAEKQPLPADDEKTPESLKKLRAIYRDQLAKLDEQRTANTAALLAPYTAKLQELEATLTKTDRIAEAKEVMDYREGLKAETPPAPAPAMATSTTTPPAAFPTAPPVPKVKGDDRKAAEWVLSVAGSLTLHNLAKTITSPADLPKGRLSIKHISLDNNNGGIKAFTDADFVVLGGLEKMESITLNKLPVSAAIFATLATCPALSQINTQYNSFGDDLWSHLASTRSLTGLAFQFDSQPVSGVGIGNLAQAPVKTLHLSSLRITDAALPEIASLSKLEILALEDARITDEGIQSLAALKQLKNLHVHGTSITAAGLAALKGCPINGLGFGRTISEVAAQAAEVAALFPKLERLKLPRESAPLLEDWAAIGKAFPALKVISMDSHKFADANLEGIEALPTLEELDLHYPKLTDAGIAKISLLKKLFWLNIADAHITDAGLETLAGMKALKVLRLPKPGGNSLTAEGIAKLKKKRPDLKVN